MKYWEEVKSESFKLVEVFDITDDNNLINTIIWDGKLEHLAGIINYTLHETNKSKDLEDELIIKWLKEHFTGDDFMVDGLLYHVIVIKIN